jgi:hypothetical protein
LGRPLISSKKTSNTLAKDSGGVRVVVAVFGSLVPEQQAEFLGALEVRAEGLNDLGHRDFLMIEDVIAIADRLSVTLPGAVPIMYVLL